MTYDNANVFAKILRGEAPCIKVCESASALAFMDAMPQSDGHVLVVPKEAAETIYELTGPGAAACMSMVQRVAVAMREALQPDGLLIAQFNGEAAGQTIAHVHFHVIPRWAGQPLRPHGQIAAEPATLESLARRLRAALATADRAGQRQSD